MKVVLVKPWSGSIKANSHMVGLTYIAGYLREKGHDAIILDAAFFSMEFDALKTISLHTTFKPTLLTY